MLVDIYCRTATHDRNTYAKLERQEITCRSYCEARGFTVGMVHHEVAAGTTYPNRRQVQHILRRCREGAIQGIVVADSERVSHLPSPRTAFTGELQQHNVTLYVVQDASVALQS
jgi:DNA invertase Pin-like site-specific DNA recombinase